MASPMVGGSGGEKEATSIGVRIAGTLAALVGVLTILTAVAIGIPALSGEQPTLLPLVVGLLAGTGACTAAWLIWRRRRIGILVLIIAWGLPVFASLALGAQARGNILLTAALLLAAANWKSMR